MKRSESISTITGALCAFRTNLPKIELNSTVKVKTKDGGQYSFRYATFPHIKNIAEPFLVENGLFVSQFIEMDGNLTTLLSHISGEFFETTCSVGNTNNKSAQEYGSLVTYFKRYSYCAVLGIAADDDDDANSGDGNGMEQTKLEEPLPLMTENQYKSALERAGKGEENLMSKITASLRMKKEYRAGIEAAIKSGKQPEKGKEELNKVVMSVVITAMNNSRSMQELTEVFNKNTEYHTQKEFIEAFTKAKNKLDIPA